MAQSYRMVRNIGRTVFMLLFFENDFVTGESFRKMLINYAFPLLKYLREDYILQQDGAPPHFFTRVKSYLNNRQSGNQIGRRGPIPWPHRSPDFTPCDFFLWEHVKSKIYSTPVESLEELYIRIRTEVRNITQEKLIKIWKNTKLRQNYETKAKNGHQKNVLQRIKLHVHLLPIMAQYFHKMQYSE